MNIAYFGYHELSLAPSGDVYTISPAHLRHSIAALCAVLPLEAFHITFDDAHLSHALLACPILEETGMRASFFVPTAWVGSRLHTATWSQLRSMRQAGHRLGSHTHTHPLLTGLSQNELDTELITSRQILEDKLGEAVHSISLPGGRGDHRVMEACRRAGYTQIFTSSPSGPIPDSRTVRGRLIVRRATRDALLVDYARGAAGVVDRLQRGYRLRRGIRAILGDSHYQQLWRTLLRKESSPVTVLRDK